MKSRRLLFLVPLLALAVTLGVLADSPKSAGAAIDLRVLVMQHFDAQNRGDLAALSDLYSDDAIVITPGLCMTPCVGRDAFLPELNYRLSINLQIQITSLREIDGRAVGVSIARADPIRACNHDRIIVNFTISAKDDKVTEYTALPDISDPQTAGYVACVRAAAAASISPPSTGDGGLK
jgi:ketosteroid isomerase-like protein